jgi:hypothetical protein
MILRDAVRSLALALGSSGRAGLAILVLCLSACNPTPDASGAPASAAPALRAEVAYDGFVVPQNASELRAPQNTFRIGSWNSQSSWIKLVGLSEDGKEVKKGDVIGKFEFPGERAREFVDREIRQAEAKRDQSGVTQAEEVDKLIAQQQHKLLDADRAELDTRRRGVISERDWELARIEHRLAIFDADATGQHIDAVKRSLRAEANYHERNVERAQSLDGRYKIYEKLFKVLSPHDGIVRHAFHRRRGRKVEKGDGMPAGMHFASVAEDDQVWVQFFVPEAQWTTLGDRKEFLVETSGEPAIVDRVKMDEFPQELGFLKNNDNLPNGREKAYVVWAKFRENPEDLSAGVEIRVRPR